ncbi:hypothetical protein QJQ45_006270 [Haematococcus lacustris]|nr:hypothetical protein QJQ45_006270 [Haematococcus lacustris]
MQSSLRPLLLLQVLDFFFFTCIGSGGVTALLWTLGNLDTAHTFPARRAGSDPVPDHRRIKAEAARELPTKGKEYPALGFKKLRDRAPKAKAQQPVAQ